MRLLLKFADAVDAASEWIGQWLKWLVLLSSLISAGNALVRYTLRTSSGRQPPADAFLRLLTDPASAIVPEAFAARHGLAIGRQRL